MPKCIHTVEPIDAGTVTVRRQPFKFLSPVYKLSYTNAYGARECILVVSRTSFAVHAMARRVLGMHGCYDFTVGRYHGAKEPEPARSRSHRSRNA